MKKIGMIGIGAMGHSVAENILLQGWNMVLYDIRPEAYRDLLDRGAEGSESPEQLGQQTDTVLVMVNTYAHCQNVVEHLLKTFENGTIILLSTISADDVKALEKRAAAKNCRVVDCPVSGGTAGAKAGALTVMAGCPDDTLSEILPLLKCFGTKIFHVGQNVGDGQTMKAINQLLVGIHMCAAAEAFNLATQSGMDLDLVYDVICSGAGMSRIFENRGKFLIDRDFSTRSTLQIQLKDTTIACETAEAAGAPAFLANTARELFQIALNRYPAMDDSIEVVRVYETLSKNQPQSINQNRSRNNGLN